MKEKKEQDSCTFAQKQDNGYGYWICPWLPRLVYMKFFASSINDCEHCAIVFDARDTAFPA